MKKVFFYAIFILLGLQMNAQVRDISLTITPTANYTWWDKQVSIQNGPMVGGMLGFGLGRYVELRGVYEQSLDLKNTLKDLKAPEDVINKFQARTVDVVRWGGEFKANIPTGAGLAPYLTLGSGIQRLKVDKSKNEQIYLSAGLGTKINLSNRVTFHIEGKGHAFNLDQGNMLRVNDPDNNSFDEWIDKNITDERMLNWSVNAGLQIYLGGRNPNTYTALDRAYERQFSSGFTGMRFVLEPGGAYINFDDDSNFENTYLLGGAVGIDFTDFVGVRAFYYQSTKDEKISTDWDDLAIYGGDFLAKLNVPRGIVPYVTIGGGYLNAYDSYTGKVPALPSKSGYFAKGGVGLTIPLAKYFEVFGAANMLLLTDKEDPKDVKSADELKKHMMYNAGLKFNLGRPANPDRVLDRYVQRHVDDRTMMYEQRLNELRDELNQAYETNDSLRAARVMKEKKRIEEEIAYKEKEKEKEKYVEPSSYETVTRRPVEVEQGESKVRLTPEELESLIDKVIDGVERQEYRKETTEERIDRLERLLLESNRGGGYYPQQNYGPQSYAPQNVQPTSNQELLNELQRINDKIDANAQKIDNALLSQGQNVGDKTVIVTPNAPAPVAPVAPVTPVAQNDNVVDNNRSNNVITDNTSAAPVSSWVVYKGISPFLGFSFGEKSSAILGIKGNYAFSSSKFVFIPDLYFGLGNEAAYGINANVIYPVFSAENFTPYIGTGLGLNKIDNFNFGINLILGTYLNVGNGSLFVDYTSRRLFKNNQLSVGYRFDF